MRITHPSPGVAALFLLLAAAASALAQAPAGITVYHYDPLAGIQSPEAFEGKAGPILEKLSPALKLQTFTTLSELAGAIAAKAPDFVFLPPYLRKEIAQGAALTPLLIRERDKSCFFELVIVGVGNVGDLRGKTIAAAGDAVPPAFLDGILFRGTTLKAEDVRVLQVSKDIDGVLAAGSGQAAGACATPSSVELVKKANPAAAGNLNVLHSVATVPLATVYAWGQPDAAKTEEVKRVLGSLHKSDGGRKLLKLLRADRLVPVDAALLEKLGK